MKPTWTCAFLTVSGFFLLLCPVRHLVAQPDPAIRNLRAERATLQGDWLIHAVPESFRGLDLNGDGDTRDAVIHAEFLPTGETQNLGLADLRRGVGVREFGPQELGIGGLELPVVRAGKWILVWGSEVAHVHNLDTGETINLQSMKANLVAEWVVYGDENVSARNLETGETTNIGLALGVLEFSSFVPFRDRLLFNLRESTSQQDLNDDGDRFDRVLHVHDLSTGETRNLGASQMDLPSFVQLDLEHIDVVRHIVYSVPESFAGEDLNGDGDTQDGVIHVHRDGEETPRNLRLTGTFAGRTENLLIFATPELHTHDLSTGETTNLRLTPVRAGLVSVSNDWLAFWAPGELNVYNLERGESQNLGLLPPGAVGWGARAVSLYRDWLVFGASEAKQGEDLNGDADLDDVVVQVVDLETGSTRNVGLDVRYAERRASMPGSWISESSIVLDTPDTGFLHLHDVEAGGTKNLGIRGRGFARFNRLSENWLVIGASRKRVRNDPSRCFGDEEHGDGVAAGSETYVFCVDLFAHDLTSGETTDLGLPTTYEDDAGSQPKPVVSGNWLLHAASEGMLGEDLNGDGWIGADDRVWHLVDLRELPGNLPTIPEPSRFVRGDCNDDGRVDISDGVCILNWLFLNGKPPACTATSNTNGDDNADISDATYLLNHLFLRGLPPTLPFPDCGTTILPRDAALGCLESSEHCTEHR